MSDMFTNASPLSLSLNQLEKYSKNIENIVHIETSNGKNCSTCNKARVCKYQENVIKDVENIISALEKKRLPLSVNINCREWSGENSGLVM